MGDGTLHLIALAVTLHRVNCVVIGRPRFKTVHTHAENRIGMVLVQSDVRFSYQVEVLGISAVVYDTEMLVCAPGIVARPRDNSQPVFYRFECRAFGDLDAGGSSGRGK